MFCGWSSSFVSLGSGGFSRGLQMCCSGEFKKYEGSAISFIICPSYLFFQGPSCLEADYFHMENLC